MQRLLSSKTKPAQKHHNSCCIARTGLSKKKKDATGDELNIDIDRYQTRDIEQYTRPVHISIFRKPKTRGPFTSQPNF